MWTAVDPAEQHFNRYLYGGNNPITRIDPDGLSDMYFFRDNNMLVVTYSNGSVAGCWNAANNVASSSNGQWPAGTYNYAYTVPHAGDGRDSRLGDVANFVFSVPNRVGMGVHSGRENSTDGAGRSGYEYCTFGCIRTTHEAMSFINDVVIGFQNDPLQTITVVDDSQQWYNARNGSNQNTTPGPWADGYVFDE